MFFFSLSLHYYFQARNHTPTSRQIDLDGHIHTGRDWLCAAERQRRLQQNLARPVGPEAGHQAGASRFHDRQVREETVRGILWEFFSGHVFLRVKVLRKECHPNRVLRPKCHRALINQAVVCLSVNCKWCENHENRNFIAVLAIQMETISNMVVEHCGHV